MRFYLRVGSLEYLDRCYDEQEVRDIFVSTGGMGLYKPNGRDNSGWYVWDMGYAPLHVHKELKVKRTL